MQDAFTVHKGHIKCTVAQKEALWPPFLVLIFNLPVFVDIKSILYKKSLIRLIRGTNLLKSVNCSEKEIFGILLFSSIYCSGSWTHLCFARNTFMWEIIYISCAMYEILQKTKRDKMAESVILCLIGAM